MVDEKMMIVWIIWLFSVEIINVRCINYDDVAKKKMRPSNIVINKEIMNTSHATESPIPVQMGKHKSDRIQEENANSYRSPIININNIKINLTMDPKKEKTPKEKQLSNKGCRTKEDNPCVFPFKYREKQHTRCVDVSNKGVFWCAVNKTLDGNVDMWGDCDVDLCNIEDETGYVHGNGSGKESKNAPKPVNSRGRSIRRPCAQNQQSRGPLSYFVNSAQQLAKKCDRKCTKGRRGIRCRKRVKKCKDEAHVKANC